MRPLLLLMLAAPLASPQETQTVYVRLPEGEGNRSRFVGRRTDLYGPLVATCEPERYYTDRGRLTSQAEERREETRRKAPEGKGSV